MEYDIIIVGGSIAGSTLAMFLSKSDLSIAIVDKNPREKIGEKICGDGISASYFDKLGIPKPTKNEIYSVIRSAKIISPNFKDQILVKGEGYTIDRLKLNQRFLKIAEENGVEIIDRTNVLEPIIRDNRVSGVVARKGKEIIKIHSKVVVDASGVTGVIRNKLRKYLVESSAEPFDLIIACRDVIRFKHQSDGSLEIYLGHKFSPGGYAWIFPEGEEMLNIGLGVQPVSGFTKNPKDLLERFKRIKGLSNAEILKTGCWPVPVRRPLAQLVYEGFLVLGDAAFQANPLHGGGMGNAMVAAKIALDVLLEAEKFTIDELWRYAYEYMRGEGAKNAALEVPKLLLQGFKDKDFEWLISKSGITSEEVASLEFSLRRKGSIWKKLILNAIVRKPLLLRRFKKARDLYREILSHYKNYPKKYDRKALKRWYNIAESLILKARKYLWRNPYKI